MVYQTLGALLDKYEAAVITPYYLIDVGFRTYITFLYQWKEYVRVEKKLEKKKRVNRLKA